MCADLGCFLLHFGHEHPFPSLPGCSIFYSLLIEKEKKKAEAQRPMWGSPGAPQVLTSLTEPASVLRERGPEATSLLPTPSGIPLVLGTPFLSSQGHSCQGEPRLFVPTPASLPSIPMAPEARGLLCTHTNTWRTSYLGTSHLASSGLPSLSPYLWLPPSPPLGTHLGPPCPPKLPCLSISAWGTLGQPRRILPKTQTIG